jgi:hypothetical protein
MKTTFGLDQCLSFINCHLQSPHWSGTGDAGLIKCVTASRQAGCGAHVFAEELAGWLRNNLPEDATPWTIFDRNLLAAVLQDHHLPARLTAFMPEDRISQLDDIIQQLFILHPPTETLVRQTSETILHLAELGHVIILGRGANLVTQRLPGALHVRLIGSVEQRIARQRQFDHLDRKDALKRIKQEDGGRRRYIKKYFGKDVDDPLLYHFVINSDWVALEDAARTVGTFAGNCQSTQTAKVSLALAEA